MLPGDTAIQTFCVGKDLKILLAPLQTLSALLIKNHATKAYGEWRHQTEMSSQLHALGCYIPRERGFSLGPWGWGAANTSTISETIYQYVDIIFKSRIHKILLFSLWNQKARYCVYKTSPFVPRTNKINLVCALLSYLCKINSRASKWSLIQASLLRPSMQSVPLLAIHATCPAHPTNTLLTNKNTNSSHAENSRTAGTGTEHNLICSFQ